MNKIPLEFDYGTYDAFKRSEKSVGTLFFTTDTHQLFKGDVEYTKSVRIMDSLPSIYEGEMGIVYIIGKDMIPYIFNGEHYKSFGSEVITHNQLSDGNDYPILLAGKRKLDIRDGEKYNVNYTFTATFNPATLELKGVIADRSESDKIGNVIHETYLPLTGGVVTNDTGSSLTIKNIVSGYSYIKFEDAYGNWTGVGLADNVLSTIHNKKGGGVSISEIIHTNNAYSDTLPLPLGETSVGSAKTLSRSDHVHPTYILDSQGRHQELLTQAHFSNNTPKSPSITGMVGMSTTEIARGDHIHPYQDVTLHKSSSDNLEFPLLLGGEESSKIKNMQFYTPKYTTNIKVNPYSGLASGLTAEKAECDKHGNPIDETYLPLTGGTIYNGDVKPLTISNVSNDIYLKFQNNKSQNIGIGVSGSDLSVFMENDEGLISYEILHENNVYSTDVAKSLGSASAGTSSKLARVDHVHPTYIYDSNNKKQEILTQGNLSNTFPNAPYGNTGSQGTSNMISRADHIHPEQVNITGNAATATADQKGNIIDETYLPITGGNISNNVPNPLTISNISNDVYLKFQNNKSQNIGIGVSGSDLSVYAENGNSYSTYKILHTNNVFGTDKPIGLGEASTGNSDKSARIDHVHPPYAPSATDTSQTSSRIITQADLSNIAPSNAPDGIVGNPGVSNKVSRYDHVHPAQTSVTGSSGSCTGNSATATAVMHDEIGSSTDSYPILLCGEPFTKIPTGGGNFTPKYSRSIAFKPDTGELSASIFTGQINASNIVLNDSITQSDFDYVLGMDSFADGGTVHWQNLSNLVVGEANKVSKSLTIQGNGTTLNGGIYNGSSAKTVNITPSAIGAAESSHTHNGLTYYGICSTDSTVVAKEVNIEGFELYTGVKVSIKFENNNTTPMGITLNINNTGAKSVYIAGSTVSRYYAMIESGQVYDFIYDGTNYILLQQICTRVKPYSLDSYFPITYNTNTSTSALSIINALGMDSDLLFNPSTGVLKAKKFTSTESGQLLLSTSVGGVSTADITIDGLWDYDYLLFQFGSYFSVDSKFNTIVPIKYIADGNTFNIAANMPNMAGSSSGLVVSGFDTIIKATRSATANTMTLSAEDYGISASIGNINVFRI